MFEFALKIGQIAGALIMAAGVTSCIVDPEPMDSAWLLLGGAALYGACRLVAWLVPGRASNSAR